MRPALTWAGRQIIITAVAVLQTLALLETWRITLNRPSPVPSGEYRRGVSLALALAMLVPAGFAFLATAAVAAPQVSMHQQKSLFGGVLAAAWPRGHNPVLVTGGRILDCLDPQCHDVNTTALGYGVSEPSGSVMIRSDGSVYAASRAGIEVCDTRRVCERRPNPVEQFNLARARAIVLAPYGGIYIATAREVPSAQGLKESAIELALVFCAQVTCDRPDVVRLGTVPGSLATAAGPVLAPTSARTPART